MGHGIGRRIHELPHIPNYYVPQFNEPLTSGLVLTIEPIIASGSGSIRMAADGWTMLTRDRSRAAHVEHTVVIQDGDPLILTA
jgi:methionyl aminopeptidase